MQELVSGGVMHKFERFVNLLEKYGKYFLVLTFLLMIFSLVGIILVNIETDFSIFMPTKSGQAENISAMNAAFGDSDQVLLLIETNGETEDLRSLNNELEGLLFIDGIRSAESAIPAQLADASTEEFEKTIEMLSAINSGTLLQVRKEGGFWLTVRINLAPSSNFPNIIREIENYPALVNRAYLLSGEPYLEGKIYSYILRVLLFLPPAAILLLLLVFRLRIGSMRATMLSMVPAIIGGVVTLGTLSWWNGTISIMTAIVPIFIIVLGSADGLHVTSHVIDRLGEGKSNRQAIVETLHAVGIPIIMTSVTTMVGFLSMLLIDSKAIREMGIGAAWGILLAGTATWIVLPILLLHQKPLKIKHSTRKSLVLVFLERIQGWPAILITLIIIAVAIPGALQLRSDFSMLSMYKKNTEVRQTIEKASDALGGAIPVNLMFPTDTIFDPAASAAVLEFQDRAAEKGISFNSISFFSIVRDFVAYQMGVHSIPENPVAQEKILQQLISTNPSLLSNFSSADKEQGRAFFFLPDLNDETLKAFIDLAEEVSTSYAIDLKPVGSAFAMKEMNDKIIVQQIKSLVLAVLMVILLSTLTQRSLKLGLLSGLPIIITLIGLFGFMGYAGIELSVISGIMTALTVGVGIDYAIHYISLFRYERRRIEAAGSAYGQPATNAMRYVATPILANAMGLAIGFSAMNLSPFRIHVTLSLLMWVTMLLSAFLSLSLLPTLLGIKKERQGRR